MKEDKPEEKGNAVVAAKSIYETAHGFDCYEIVLLEC